MSRPEAGVAAPSPRVLKVAEEVRRELAALFARRPFRDPVLAGLRLTVNRVDLSADLSLAKIFINPPEDAAAALAALTHARGFLRSSLAKRAGFRRVPDLSFRLDPAPAGAQAFEAALARATARAGA